MATKLTKKQKEVLTDKITGLIKSSPALRMTLDSSVNDMNINQISGELNRIHYRAIGKDLPTEINIPVKQLGSGDPSPDNIRPIVSYEIDGIGTIYGGDLNIETGVLTVTQKGLNGSAFDWIKIANYSFGNFNCLPTDTVKFVASRSTVISSQYKSESNSTASAAGDNYVWIRSATGRRIYVKDVSKSDMTAAEFKNAMDGVTFVYELDTPETYTLTLQQMLQLLDQL